MARGQPGLNGGTKNATDKDYLDFITAYVSVGEVLRTVSENTGIPLSTLSKWKHRVIDEDGDLHSKYVDELERVRTEKRQYDEEARKAHLQKDANLRAELQTAYLELQMMKVNQLRENPEMLATVPFNQMSTAYGTTVDKDRLISGEATAKEEQHIKIELPTEVSDLFG